MSTRTKLEKQYLVHTFYENGPFKLSIFSKKCHPPGNAECIRYKYGKFKGSLPLTKQYGGIALFRILLS